MSRIFIVDSRRFPDPDPNLPVDEVRKSLANFFPELANATTSEKTQDGDQVITFEKKVGHKGYGSWKLYSWKKNNETDEQEELGEDDLEHITAKIKEGHTQGDLP